jgi:GntR family transcriptional regulator
MPDADLNPKRAPNRHPERHLERDPDPNATIAYLRDQLDLRTGQQPIYRKLSDALAEGLRDGLIDRESPLPSERVLASGLGISRVTVRHALQEIAADGLLVRRQGARTEIAVRLEKALTAVAGFTDELRSRGMVPGQRWMSRQTLSPTPSEALALGLSNNDRIVRLLRVRLADGMPIAIERATIPQSILPSGDLVTESLYEALKRLGAPPVRGVQRIHAGVMNRQEAELLESSPGTALLIIERRCFLDDGRPVEYTETRYHGEHYDFLTELGN